MAAPRSWKGFLARLRKTATEATQTASSRVPAIERLPLRRRVIVRAGEFGRRQLHPLAVVDALDLFFVIAAGRQNDGEGEHSC